MRLASLGLGNPDFIGTDGHVPTASSVDREYRTGSPFLFADHVPLEKVHHVVVRIVIGDPPTHLLASDHLYVERFTQELQYRFFTHAILYRVEIAGLKRDPFVTTHLLKAKGIPPSISAVGRISFGRPAVRSHGKKQPRDHNQ
jgi:hypothetical protein